MTEEGLLIGFLVLVIGVAIGAAIRGARMAILKLNKLQKKVEAQILFFIYVKML